MQKESNDSLVYVPTMHREFFPKGLPECVRPVWPGLPDGRDGKRNPEEWYAMALPYTSREAAACLADLAQLDEAGLAALSEAAATFQDRERRAQQERRDLKRFAATGELRDADGPSSAEAPGRWAQRFLLLGWLQEERVLEMERLAARYRTGAARLASHLGDEEEDVFSGLLGMMRELVPDNPALLLPSWRFMLDLLAILLPEDCVLCTADARMGGALVENGLCREPLSPEVSARLPQGWRAPEGWRVTCGEEPLWKLIGKKDRQPDRPWLDRRQLVILCMADDTLEQA